AENPVSQNYLKIASYEKEKYEMAQLMANDKITSSFSEGKKWAVVIGISDYRNPGIADLKYSSRDANAFYSFLVDKGEFPVENVKLLLDNEATLKNVKSAIGTFLARSASRNDTVI